MNISSSSSTESRPNLHKKRSDDKYYKYKRKTKLKDFISLTNNFIKSYKTYILSIKELLKKNIPNINPEINTNKLNENIDYITKKIEILFSKYINDIKNSFNSKYENILKLYEQKIRYLYENKFNLELNRRILEESNKNLLRKEKEYELIKEKTGIVVVNDKVINNDRKENEIFILRKENSLLKDIIEKQKKEIAKLKDSLKTNKSSSRSKKGSKDKSYINNPKLIIKYQNPSKLKPKQKVQSLSLGPGHYRKLHYSNPKSIYPFQLDFFSSLNNSLSKSKNSRILNSYSYKNYFRDLARKIYNTSIKKKSKSKPFINNIINNIKVQKIHDIKRISPVNLIRKNRIPNKSKKNISLLNKKEKKMCNLKKRGNNSTLCIKAVKRDLNNTNITQDYISHSRKKNNSEYITDKSTIINPIIYPLVMKTINNEKRINNQSNNKRCLSPSYGNLKCKLTNVKSQLNSGLKEIKSSKSFTRNNNVKNNFIKKNGVEMKKLFLNKVDNYNKKVMNLVFKRGVKNLSYNNRYTTNSNKKNKKIKIKNKSFAIINNIKTINNNSKTKLNIIKK